MHIFTFLFLLIKLHQEVVFQNEKNNMNMK